MVRFEIHVSRFVGRGHEAAAGELLECDEDEVPRCDTSNSSRTKSTSHHALRNVAGDVLSPRY
jgi:hypothetical protein